MPHAHGAIRNTVPISKKIPVLPQILRQAGYDTAAFISGWTLRKNLSKLDRGFKFYDDEMTDTYKLINAQRFGDQVTDRAISWLQTRSHTPFFLFVHYFDPHVPYSQQPEWYADFLQSLGSLHPEKKPKLLRKLAAYDSEIAFADAQIARLLEALRRAGHFRDSWIVIFSDHGEAFGEHGDHQHGRRVYAPVLHIPLLIRPPGGLAKTRLVADRVSLVDLFSTFLEVLGLKSRSGHGESLVPLFDGSQQWERRPVYFETFTLWSPVKRKEPSRIGVFLKNLKVILLPKKKELRVFDLARDPGETRNISQRHPELQRYRRLLLDWWRSTRVVQEEPDLSAEQLEQLRQLGYVN